MLAIASIVILGILAQWVAWRLKMPAIFPLIVIGLVVGPIASMDFLLGEKLIDPRSIFAGNTLNYFVSLSVGIILFEGGLTLRLKEVRQVASTVRNLVLIAPFISLLGGGAFAYFILGLDASISLLFGALIIVTGPTVIGPILRNVRPNKKVSTVLKWEGIVIDPVGALFAVLVYEFILSGAGTSFTVDALITFGLTLFAGATMGTAGAFLLRTLLKRNWVPEYLVNVVSLALVFLVFVMADEIAHESGLLAVTVMGVILANMKIPRLEEILSFKESLTVLLISVLFIVLSANIDLEQMKLLGYGSVIVTLLVMFVLRPVSVFLCAIGSNLNWREKLFISWIGPRGIVAAAIASIFSLGLIEKGILSPEQAKDAALLLPLTFLVIVSTVVIQGLSAKWVAKLLKVKENAERGILIAGAHPFARSIARYLSRHAEPYVLVDTSISNIHEAKQQGLHVMQQTILEDSIADDAELMGHAYFWALTASNEVNILACRKFKQVFHKDNSFRLITPYERKFTSLVKPKNILFSERASFNALSKLVVDFPEMREIQIASDAHLKKLIKQESADFIPILVRKVKTKSFKCILASDSIQAEVGDYVAYFGQLKEADENPTS